MNSHLKNGIANASTHYGYPSLIKEALHLIHESRCINWKVITGLQLEKLHRLTDKVDFVQPPLSSCAPSAKDGLRHSPLSL